MYHISYTLPILDVSYIHSSYVSYIVIIYSLYVLCIPARGGVHGVQLRGVLAGRRGPLQRQDVPVLAPSLTCIVYHVYVIYNTC